MKKLLFICLALAPICACSTLTAATEIASAATSSAPLGDRITMDERGMYAVDLLYVVPADAYRNANEHHLITPDLRARVRPILQQMRQVQLACRTAYRLGDATSWNARVADLQQLKAQVTALLPASN